MHGYLRLVLAFGVLAYHLGYGADTLHLGPICVVVFYILSGYVVAKLLDKFFPPGTLWLFYKERFLRIYPVYALLLLASAVFFFCTGIGQPEATALNVFAHLTVVPLNYFMFWDVAVLRSINLSLLPTAWSLALEIQAFLLLPLISRSNVAKTLLGMTSLVIFGLSVNAIIDPNLWGYRLLPGVLFMFLAGDALYRILEAGASEGVAFARFYILTSWLGVLASCIVAWSIGRFQLGLPSPAVGFLVGVPLAWVTTNRIRVPGGAMAGQLSYGVFLIHMPLIYAYSFYFRPEVKSLTCLLAVSMASLAVSWLVVTTIERMVWKWRRSITNSAAAHARIRPGGQSNGARSHHHFFSSGPFRLALCLVAAGSVFVIFQARVGYPLSRTLAISPRAINQSGDGVFAASQPFTKHRPHPVHLRTRLIENGRRPMDRVWSSSEVRRSTGGTYSTSRSQVWFKTSDGTDPRTNGKSYELEFPVVPPLWLEIAGWISIVLLVPLFLSMGHRKCSAHSDSQSRPVPSVTCV